jgi:hypothetical protein
MVYVFSSHAWVHANLNSLHDPSCCLFAVAARPVRLWLAFGSLVAHSWLGRLGSSIGSLGGSLRGSLAASCVDPCWNRVTNIVELAAREIILCMRDAYLHVHVHVQAQLAC